MAQINAQFGLDKPLPVRFWDYLVRLMQFDLGTSFRTREPVIDLIAARIGPSIELAAAAMGLAAVVGIPLGFLAAMRPGSLLDSLTMIGAVSGHHRKVPTINASISPPNRHAHPCFSPNHRNSRP